MATTSCFQVVLPLKTCSLPSSISYSKSIKLKPNTNDNLRIKCFASINARNSSSSSSIPMPPAAPVTSSDTPPYLDLFESPKLMATPAQVERSVSYNEHRPRTPPPDLPSLLLHGRIVYIGMPLVAAVTELVVAELMYLQWMDPKAPIYIYINSTGTTRDDGESVGMETEGFAIYDSMMQLKNEIHTVAVGAAIGQACLLLAAGIKGSPPRVPSSGLMPASDVLIRAKEAVVKQGCSNRTSGQAHRKFSRDCS
ncbi:ATP-DEPENDENT CLP PROTEASE PROTEOLYTIC SUBUNIT-RELATED PROTEIN 3 CHLOROPLASTIC [Salix koriyanagi]|uniref:ATP-dependent Clp protease proteolytic subunit n=1 Tax=Salix koriyanagi TaxID=2511006 RepID=A0A9Q1A406_9ROSI|nr:ATP-DEPENDENT CLP PROTEASE PROTEOLYTIC SUBUNIT-RELATED PROTEIN 3 CHLOROPLASTIC [Salix koriyanagi]